VIRRDAIQPGLAHLAGVALGATIGLLRGGLIAALLGALVGFVGGELLQRRRGRAEEQRRRERMIAGLPDALELLAAAVAGGAAPDIALRHVARHLDEPVGPALERALGAARDGDVGAALSREDATLRPLGALLRQSVELGVPVAEALRLLSVDARALARSQARERAAAAGPRMLLVVGGILAPAALLVVIGGQALVLRSLIGPDLL
jgi:Flp pilus assembly protein TadB